MKKFEQLCKSVGSFFDLSVKLAKCQYKEAEVGIRMEEIVASHTHYWKKEFNAK